MGSYWWVRFRILLNMGTRQNLVRVVQYPVGLLRNLIYLGMLGI